MLSSPLKMNPKFSSLGGDLRANKKRYVTQQLQVPTAFMKNLPLSTIPMRTYNVQHVCAYVRCNDI